MINFLDSESATRGYMSAQQPYGDIRFASRIKTVQYFYEVVEWSKKSPTAQKIIKVIQDAKIEVDFIGMHGGFQCFDESALNTVTQKKKPTIYIDVNGKLQVFVRQPHELALSRLEAEEKFKRGEGGKPKMEPFDNKIALLHELGHAKQFVENTQWYLHFCLQSNRGDFREAINTAANKFWTQKFTPKPKQSVSNPPNSIYAPGVSPPPPPAPGVSSNNAKSSVRSKVNALVQTRTQKPVDLKWAAVIDIDNIQKHEWPICKEMNLPQRFNYTDLSV
jgi:hypothetical protein